MSGPQGMPDSAGWDASVRAYVDFAEPNTAAYAGPMVELAVIRPGDAVLDVAAGSGALTLPLIEAGATVTAIDWSAGMIDVMRQRLDAMHDGGAHRAMQMDGQALEFADASFDAALSLFGVILFPDFRAGLAEMVRVTRAGGRVVVGCWTDYAPPMMLFRQAVAEAVPDLPPSPTPAGLAAMGTPEGFEAEMARLSLASIATRRERRGWSMTRRQVAAQGESMLFQMPPWPQLSESQRRDVLAAMARIAERDAGLPFEGEAIVGAGVKPA